MTAATLAAEPAPVWSTHPAAAAAIRAELDRATAANSGLRAFAVRLREETGTRLTDWLDHLLLPAERAAELDPAALGFAPRGTVPHAAGGAELWEHTGGLFPRLLVSAVGEWGVALKVESAADFLVAHGIDARTPILGDPGSWLRGAQVMVEGGCTWGVIERHGHTGFLPETTPPELLQAARRHAEAFRRRRREFASDTAGFEHARELFRAACDELPRDWACDLFFAAEREYWQRRNRAARMQKERQDRLGLGWANHDHHTYRSNRESFIHLIRNLEEMGFVCRERFYAGKEAGWGAQVIEQPRAGVVIFADVDLSPEEVAGDFSHQPLPARQTLGTVGLWCRLHGDAFLQAGMHHLECQFDFAAAREQLGSVGVNSMKPFTDFAHLRQCFTQGEIWPVKPERIAAALAAGEITAEQAEKFRTQGAIGSHLEILQREDGYKGFNQTGINEIILATDARRAVP